MGSHSNILKIDEHQLFDQQSPKVQKIKENGCMLQSKSQQKLSPVQQSNVCNIEEHDHMISLEEHNRLKQDLLKWQSTAQRWQNMANRHEHSHETIEIQTKQKDIKYKQKIRNQQNEILSLQSILKTKQYEIDQQLLAYKKTNEMRKKNSYIDGTLWKFAGDGMNNVKFNKAPKLKYVMYVPTKRRLYYSDSTMDDAETKLVNVTDVTHKNEEVMLNLPDKYKRIWIKITGQSRIVLFVAKNKLDADRWYVTIKNSLRDLD